MGQDKASLAFGNESMLGCVVRVVRGVVSPVVVVASPAQALPPLARDVIVAYDDRENAGPLAGLYVGIRQLAALGYEYAFLCGCDMPLLRGELVARLVAMIDNDEALIPLLAGQPQPMCAIYATSLAAAIADLLQQGRGPRALAESRRARFVDAEALRDLDPQLGSFHNVNSPGDLQSALSAARRFNMDTG